MTARDPNTAPVIEEGLAQELEEHKGRWVAVDQGVLAAVADSAIEARAGALAKGITDPLVFRVSAHPDRIAFL